MKDHLLLWDVGGVLLKLSFSRFYQALSELTPFDRDRVKEMYDSSGLEMQMLAGAVEKEEYLDRLRDILHVLPGTTDEQLLAAYDCRYIERNSGIQRIRQIIQSAGYPSGILSNIGSLTVEELKRRYSGFFAVTGPCLLSYEEKSIKPELKMFRKAQQWCDENGISSVTFVEDKAAYAAVGIDNFGWNGVLYTACIDKAESIRAAHLESAYPKKNFRIANSDEELLEALRSFGFVFSL